MYERFTDRARKVMQLANQEAQRLNHEYIGTEHILLGLVKEGSGVAANVLKNLNVDLRKVRLEVERIVQPGPEFDLPGKLPQTPRAKKVIEYSIEEARGLNHNYIGTEHLLLGLLREQEGLAAQVLMNLGLRLDTVRKETLDLLGHNVLSDEGRTFHLPQPIEGKSRTPALDSFGRDLTELARAGSFAPLVGRATDIEKMLVVLTSMRSPCLLLVGERGVGKTALVNGLAGFIARGGLPSGLPQRVVAVDLSTPSLRKGSKQDSERIIACLNEASRERIILSVEAAPLLFADPTSGTTVLHQAKLRQDSPPLILSLTPSEYYLYIAPSSDKAEVFQALYLAPLSREDTLELLRQERPRYAAYHSVEIPETLMGRVAFLADRSLTGSLPGKAIQLLDRAAALARLRGATPSVEGMELKGDSEFQAKMDEQILKDALTMLKESANQINPDIVAGDDDIPF